MTPRETLYYRALRILNDQHAHDHSVIRWAEELTESRQRETFKELRSYGFSVEEISLGAGEVARQ